MRSTSQSAVNMVSRNDNLSSSRQLLIDEFTVSRRVLVLVCGFLLVICGLLWNGNALTQVLKMPVEQVEIRGQLHFVEVRNLQSLMARYIENKYLTQSLSVIKAEMEQLPWVDTARLQRAWPNKVYVDIVEQKPVAVWSDQGLINERGEVFIPKNFAELNTASLPNIVGPEERMEQTWQRYLTLKEVFHKYNLGLRKMVLDEKGGQKLVLNNGIHVILGSQDIEQRLSRFFKVYKHYLQDKRQHIKRIDLRYTNGIAVSWLDREAYSVAGTKEGLKHDG